MPAAPTAPRLRRIIWDHEGRELCSAEIGTSIGCDLGKDPWDAGIIKELVETDTEVRIFTRNREDALCIPKTFVTHRLYFED
jgi:hypothetical protein